MSMSFLPLILYSVGVLAWAAWISPRMRRLIDPKTTDGWHTVPRDVASGLLWPAWTTVYLAALIADAILTVPTYLRILRMKRAARVSDRHTRAVRRQIRALRAQNNSMILENHYIREQMRRTQHQRLLMREHTVELEGYGAELQALINIRKRSAPPS